MIDRDCPLPIAKQVRIAEISRGTVHYLSILVNGPDLAMTRRIDELHLDWPFAGRRVLRGLLRQEGIVVGRKHVRTLMRRTGIDAVCRRGNHAV